MNGVQKSIVKLFEDKQIRIIWQEVSEGWLQIVPPPLVDTAGGPQKMNFATLAGVFRCKTLTSNNRLKIMVAENLWFKKLSKKT